MDEDFSIFQNQEDVARNLKESAENLGEQISEKAVDNLAQAKPTEKFIAKRGCKFCNGKGLIDFIPSRSGKKTRDYRKPQLETPEKSKALCKCVRVSFS